MSAPINIDLERGLLGCLMMNNATLNNIEQIIEPEDFSDGLNGEIYRHACEMISNGETASPVTMKLVFQDHWDYLVDLVAEAAVPISIASYAAGIRDLNMRRQMIADAEGFAESLEDVSLKTSESASRYISYLDDVLCKSNGSTRQSIGNAVDSAILQLEDDTEAKHVPTGLASLDRVLGGYYRGEYVIIAARPGMGKSMFASSTLLRRAIAGSGVHYISLEMTRDALAQRCLSDVVYNRDIPIPYIDMRHGGIDQESIVRLKAGSERLADASMVIEDAPGLTVPEIAARARAQQQRFQREGKRLDILCIDHIGKVRPSDSYRGQKVNEVGEISGALANLAKSLDCTVIALSQLNRGVESHDRKNKRPNLSDLRASGDIEQDADVVLFLYRSAYYLEKMEFDDEEEERKRLEMLDASRNKMEIIVSKQRSGPCRTVHAFVDLGSNCVRDLA